MRKVGPTPLEFRSYNTCKHQERVFSFSSDHGKLVVTEAILGKETRCVRVTTELDCNKGGDSCIACCSLGQHMLVIAGKDEDMSAALVSVDEGQMTESTTHITALIVESKKEWLDWPYLCPVSENRALLYFNWWDSMWYCDIKDQALTVKKLATRMPSVYGFCTVPLRLPDGKLLVAGAFPYSNDITLISCGEELKFEKVGEIPGERRYLASTVLIKERFVVGFGGWNGNGYLRDLWIFDLQTYKASPVTRDGEWHSADQLVPLVAHCDTLYLLRGQSNSISFSKLASLIQDATIRSAFLALV